MSGKTMARRPPAQRSRNTRDRRRKAPQMEMFGSGQSGGVIGAPAWPELPAEVQGTLTRLMVQLILEHADKSKTAAMTEADHDL
jgi:hypothetical protein